MGATARGYAGRAVAVRKGGRELDAQECNRDFDAVTMKKADRNALFALPVVVLIGVGIAAAGSQGGSSWHGVPVFALAVGLAFLLQWLAFVPAYVLQSERFFDITGSLTYISVTAIAVLLAPTVDGRSIVLLALVAIWAARLGAYLSRRIHKAGKDVRFAEIKPSFIRFLNAWTLQGLWVSLTLAAALAAITAILREDLGVASLLRYARLGSGVRDRGSADLQKSRFRRGPRPTRPLHRRGAVGLVAPPQLLRRDRALDRRGDHRGARPDAAGSG